MSFSLLTEFLIYEYYTTVTLKIKNANLVKLPETQAYLVEEKKVKIEP